MAQYFENCRVHFDFERPSIDRNNRTAVGRFVKNGWYR
jgi:hypothetical protein